MKGKISICIDKPFVSQRGVRIVVHHLEFEKRSNVLRQLNINVKY